MKIVLGSTAPDAAVQVLAVLVTEDDLAQDPMVNALDGALDGTLRAAIKDEDYVAKRDTVLTVPTFGKIPARKVVLVGLGKREKVGLPEVRIAAVRVARVANAEKAVTVAIALHGSGNSAAIRAAVEGIILGAYRFTRYMTGDRKPPRSIERVLIGWVGLGDGDRPTADQKRALVRGEATAAGVNLARDLVNEPPNELTPAKLAELAVSATKPHGITAKVLDREKIQAAGMRLLDAVGRGSRNEPRFIHLTYKPERARKPLQRVVLVGKGLTFDSGGLCIKPAAGMGEMKSDMAGAALAVGAMAAIGVLKPQVEVHAIIAAAENMPDGDAYRPGDIFTSLDGKTVEIINTDAEGRLVLADALTYARKLHPDVLIDHATLTGACLVALGPFTAGFYCNDDALTAQYLAASKGAGEAMWHMPLLDELRDSLKSDVADLKHTGDRYGGSITAALFLREFVGDRRWIHVDIAGPAFVDRVTPLSGKGGTGFGVMSFLNFLDHLEAPSGTVGTR